MHEDSNLEEAAHFLGQLSSSLQRPDVFRFSLSAFLSAARSVAQYALEEARTKPGGQAWYVAFVLQDPLIGFFTSTRDSNIHHLPVQVDGHIDVYVQDAAHVWDHAVVEKFDRDGNLVEVAEQGKSRADEDTEWTTDFAFVPHYKFAEWVGSEEIPELCERYISSLRGFVADGRTRGFLTVPKHAA